jgi:hypothetical protein
MEGDLTAHPGRNIISSTELKNLPDSGPPPPRVRFFNACDLPHYPVSVGRGLIQHPQGKYARRLSAVLTSRRHSPVASTFVEKPRE